MACFTGYIELFDSIEFQSKGKWDNQITVQKDKNESEQNKAKLNNQITLDTKEDDKL